MEIDNEEYEGLAQNLQEYEDGDSLLDDEVAPPPIRYFEDFDNTISDIDFSDLSGNNFKKNFAKVNRKINKKIISKKSIRKPNDIGVKQSVKLVGQKEKKISKVIVPSDQKVIVQGVSDFILSKSESAESIKNLGYYEGQRLNELILIFNNTTLLDFDVEIFNPSQPLDYLYNTSLNLNDRIQVAGGAVAYSDVLFNLLANPALIVNAKFVCAGAAFQQQLLQNLQVINKNINGVQKIVPVSIPLKIDNMQVQNDMVVFDMMKSLNRPFIPDGMDIIKYKVLAGNSITMCFYYKQVSLKKVFYKEARNSKKLL